MGYLIIFLFAVLVILSFLEDYLGRYKLPIYLFFALILIVVAGLREVGLDPDSENYENMFMYNYSSETADKVEPSYLIISSFLSLFSNDVHSLFLFYALLGVSLKFIAFRQLSRFWFVPILVYICYYFEFHEMMQIRTGVLSAMLLLSIKPLADRNKKQAFIYFLIGTLFHYSGLVLFPFLFVSNEISSRTSKILWGVLIPVGYLFYFYGFNILLNFSTEIPYIGEKLAFYQTATEKGILSATVNLKSPLLLFTIFIFYYLYWFYDTIVEEDKYFPLMMKIFAMSIFSYIALANFPVLAQRINLLLKVVIIILFTDITYTIKPRWAALSIVFLVSFIFLNYALPTIGTILFWNPDS